MLGRHEHPPHLDHVDDAGRVSLDHAQVVECLPMLRLAAGRRMELG